MKQAVCYMRISHEDEEFIAWQRRREDERKFLKLLCLINTTTFTKLFTHEDLIALFTEGTR